MSQHMCVCVCHHFLVNSHSSLNIPVLRLRREKQLHLMSVTSFLFWYLYYCHYVHSTFYQYIVKALYLIIYVWNNTDKWSWADKKEYVNLATVGI